MTDLRAAHEPAGSCGRSRLRGALRNVDLTVGATLLSIIVLCAVTSPWVFPDGGGAIDLAARLTPPFTTIKHLLGTDSLGRDVVARVVASSQVSLLVGFVSVIGATIVGAAIGMVAGYYRGVWESLLMRCADVQLALPFILVAITFTALVGADMWKLIILMVATQWVQYARVVRAEVLVLRNRDFIHAAQAIGVGDWRIVFLHLVPNLLGPLVVLMTLNVANNILLESGLTFLGLGVDPQIPSWGGMLADGRAYLQTAWWVSVFPGLAIMLTVLGLNFLSDWLRDFLDPTMSS